jgi:hypothetical protein
MSKVFPMGALDDNGNHVIPIDAIKKHHYKCPKCIGDVIFKHGEIKIAHFAHKPTYACSYYNNPSNGDIHNETILQLKYAIGSKNRPINITDTCYTCNTTNITNISNMNGIIKTEYAFTYNKHNYRADIAIIDKNDIKYMIEVKYTHKTEECRRYGDWCEIDAQDTLLQLNSTNIDNINLKCLRQKTCNQCLMGKEDVRRIQQHEKERQQREKERQQERKEWEQRRKQQEEKRRLFEEKKMLLNKIKTYTSIFNQSNVLCIHTIIKYDLLNYMTTYDYHKEYKTCLIKELKLRQEAKKNYPTNTPEPTYVWMPNDNGYITPNDELFKIIQHIKIDSVYYNYWSYTSYQCEYKYTNCELFTMLELEDFKQLVNIFQISILNYKTYIEKINTCQYCGISYTFRKSHIKKNKKNTLDDSLIEQELNIIEKKNINICNGCKRTLKKNLMGKSKCSKCNKYKLFKYDVCSKCYFNK